MRDFLMHIITVLDQLGLSIQARTNFIKSVFWFIPFSPGGV